MASKLVHDAQSMRREMDNQEQTNNLSDMRIETRFGRNVQMYRKQRHYTQFQLAELCGLNQKYISEIENGKRNVTLRVLNDLAEALGVEVKELVD